MPPYWKLASHVYQPQLCRISLQWKRQPVELLYPLGNDTSPSYRLCPVPRSIAS